MKLSTSLSIQSAFWHWLEKLYWYRSTRINPLGLVAGLFPMGLWSCGDEEIHHRCGSDRACSFWKGRCFSKWLLFRAKSLSLRLLYQPTLKIRTPSLLTFYLSTSVRSDCFGGGFADGMNFEVLLANIIVSASMTSPTNNHIISTPLIRFFFGVC